MISSDGRIEATVVPDWAGVHVRVRDIDAAAWHVAVEATTDGVTRRVWGADPMTAPGGSGYAFDALPALGVLVEYRAAVCDRDGTPTGQWSAPATVTVQSSRGVWLRTPELPSLSLNVMPVSWSGWSRPRLGGHTQVLGGGLVPFYSGRQAGRGVLDVLAQTDAELDGMHALADAKVSVLLSGSTRWSHLTDTWVSLDDLSEGIMANTPRMHAQRSWPVNLTQVPAPSTRHTPVASPVGLAADLPGLAANLTGFAVDLSVTYP